MKTKNNNKINFIKTNNIDSYSDYLFDSSQHFRSIVNKRYFGESKILTNFNQDYSVSSALRFFQLYC